MPEFFTPDEVAAMFRVKKSTVMNWHRKGLIEASVLPGSCLIRFTQDAVNAFAAGATQKVAQ